MSCLLSVDRAETIFQIEREHDGPFTLKTKLIIVNASFPHWHLKPYFSNNLHCPLCVLQNGKELFLQIAQIRRSLCNHLAWHLLDLYQALLLIQHEITTGPHMVLTLVGALILICHTECDIVCPSRLDRCFWFSIVLCNKYYKCRSLSAPEHRSQHIFCYSQWDIGEKDRSRGFKYVCGV